MSYFAIQTNYITVSADKNAFLRVESGKGCFILNPPVFEINGKEETFIWKESHGTKTLRNGGKLHELICEQTNNKEIHLILRLKTYEDSPIIRFQTELVSENGAKLTKMSNRDNITYTGFDASSLANLEEIQFAQFLPHMHSFVPVFQNVSKNAIEQGSSLAGPILIGSNEDITCLAAYEHGAEYPDSYLSFGIDRKSISIFARKGNYYDGMTIDEHNPFTSVWFQFALIDGGRDEMLAHYRKFILDYICEYSESRKPYLFYNTWNYQERGHNLNHRGYIQDLHYDRIVTEIEAAYKIGIEVFVIDTGWFIKTGDWIVNSGKFPDMLRKISAKLESYGMKMGLWFNPIVAAKSSEIAVDYPEYRMSVNGKHNSFSIWETEESYNMCLCSEFWEYFADRLISLYKELNVRYFKWDGVGQYGCDSPLHDHGGENVSAKEREECYSYMMGLRMIRVVEKLQNECPDAIVDFDITEAGRFVGLGFLAAGKYFLINNGPYAKDFDMPRSFEYLQEEPIDLDPYTNIFFYPGAARQRFCRQGVRYDSFIPSVLFLTHYLPDPPRYSQENTLASLVLGGNGIWGDLSILNEDDINFFAENFTHYKKVRDYVTRCYPIVTGEIGTSPEIHEKIDAEEGKGLICFFTRFAGEYKYVTQKLAKCPAIINGAKEYEFLPNGCLSITVSLAENGASTVFVY